jgi:hypothetical protein
VTGSTIFLRSLPRFAMLITASPQRYIEPKCMPARLVRVVFCP